MRAYSLFAILGGLGNLGLPATIPTFADTCTPAKECQLTITSNGSWTEGGAMVMSHGSCYCQSEVCKTNDCKYDKTLTATLSGASFKVAVTGPCSPAGADSKQLVIKTCDDIARILLFVYGTTDCTGSYSVWNFTVDCAKSKCGWYACH